MRYFKQSTTTLSEIPMNDNTNKEDVGLQLVLAGKSLWLETQRADSITKWITISSQLQELVLVNDFGGQTLGFNNMDPDKFCIYAGKQTVISITIVN